MNDIRRDDEEPQDDRDLLEEAKSEISEMAKEGTRHPSTLPVLVGAALGVFVGVVAFNGAWFLGLLAGAAVALYMRIKK